MYNWRKDMNKDDFKKSIQVDSTPSMKEVQEEVKTTFLQLIDKYEDNNSFKHREFLVYLASAIFLVYKEKFPQISTYLLFRTKSDLSFINNLKKEFDKSFSNSDEEFHLNSDSIEKDISGIRLVLDSVKESNISKSPEAASLLNSTP